MNMDALSLAWVLVMVMAIIIEISTQQLVSVWFAIAAFFSFVLAYLHFPFEIQLMTFVVVSVASFVVVRRYLKPYLQSTVTPTNTDRLIDQEAVVTRAISSHERGEVKVLGQFWTARCDDPSTTLSIGQSATVLAIEGATLIVKRSEED